ncbi:MAG: lactate racemase domain-containing protein [Candidatus Kryptoniota bacterium]
MLLYSRGSVDTSLTPAELEAGLYEALDKLGQRVKVVIVPPDMTRLHSRAGALTESAWRYYKEKLKDILPSIGTHSPMDGEEIETMYGGTPKNLFRVHDWRNGFVNLGDVPSDFVNQVSEGAVNYSIPIQVGKLLAEGRHDLILSIGQVVPHEVIGMASHNKNIFIGTGGKEGINKTHFLGAAYGVERIMGRVDTPVKRVLNYGSECFAKHLPIVYVLTVVGRAGDSSHENESNNLEVKGLFIGDDIECFNLAATLSLEVNFFMLDKPLKKVVVYLDPSEFKSTWLGNKAIYRTRMAIADGGELVVLAPGVRVFGEDKGNDGIIRKYGYVGTPRILELVRTNPDMMDSLGAVAHLIHGSSEGRFSITYCPGNLTKQEIESVNFNYGDLREIVKRYNPGKMSLGFNIMPDGEEVFYISNPAVGLWANKNRFN